MSSRDVFYAIGDGMYALFENTLEPIGDKFWPVVLVFGFVAFGFWMAKQVKFNKEAENNPDQIK